MLNMQEGVDREKQMSHSLINASPSPSPSSSSKDDYSTGDLRSGKGREEIVKEDSLTVMMPMHSRHCAVCVT